MAPKPQQTALAKFSQLLSTSTRNPQDFESHFHLLGHIHKYRLPYPQLVVKFGELLIQQYNPLQAVIDPFSFLGTFLNLISPNLVREHIFDIVEQVCFAAIQCHRYQLRNDCLFILEKFFKNAIRVTFLRASIYESAEKYDDAVRLYRFIIQDNRNTLYSLKAKQRLIAISKEFHNIPKTLKDLSTFTQMYSSNYDGWYELYSVNMGMGGQNRGEYYQSAILAAAHLILLEPENYTSYLYNANAHSSYGELLLDGVFGVGWDEEAGQNGQNGQNGHNRIKNDEKTEKQSQRMKSTATQLGKQSIKNLSELTGDKYEQNRQNEQNGQSGQNGQNAQNDQNVPARGFFCGFQNAKGMASLRSRSIPQRPTEETESKKDTDEEGGKEEGEDKPVVASKIKLDSSCESRKMDSFWAHSGLLENSIKIAFDHLLNARYYLCTAHHLNPNQLSALGILRTSKLIKMLVQKYPELPSWSSVAHKATLKLAESSESSETNENTKNDPKDQKDTNTATNSQSQSQSQSQITDCNDLIALALDFLKTKMATNCVEATKINLLNKKRLQRGQEPLQPMKVFDPFAATYWYQCEEWGNGD